MSNDKNGIKTSAGVTIPENPFVISVQFTTISELGMYRVNHSILKSTFI